MHPEIVGETKQSFNRVYNSVESQNEAARKFLDKLLHSTDGIIRINSRWGKLIEFRNADGFGARWDMSGKFIGFVIK